jgi:hypothetical protein
VTPNELSDRLFETGSAIGYSLAVLGLVLVVVVLIARRL